MTQPRPLVLLTLVALLLVAGLPASAQFGMTKTRVRLHVRQAPETYLPGRQIRVEVRSEVPTGQAAAAQIHAFLEQELPRANFDVASRSPETLLRVVLTQFDPRIARDVRQEMRYIRTGEHLEYNNKGQARRVEDCAMQNVQVSHYVARGTLGASLILLDLATGAQLENRAVPVEYSRDAAIAGPQQCAGVAYDSITAIESDAVSLGNYMVELLRVQLQRKLLGWVEPIEVLLAKPDELKPGNDLAVAGQWNMALQRWTVANIKKPKTEAYRQYNLGVAYEALSYASSDLSEAAESLQKAETAYQKAMELESDEKYFRPCFVRVNTGRLALQRRQEQTAQRQAEAAKRLADLEEKTAPATEVASARRPEEDSPEAKKFRDYVRLRIARLNRDLTEAERERFAVDGVTFGVRREQAALMINAEDDRAQENRHAVERYQEFYMECWADKVISPEENEQLESFRQALNLTEEQVAQVAKAARQPVQPMKSKPPAKKP